MARIERFEDIDVWKKSMDLCKRIYVVSNQPSFFSDFALRDQVRKSSISIPSNIAEGFERESNNQFIYFLLIAKASAGELRTQIYIAHNCGYIDDLTKNELVSSLTEISKSLSGFITYLRMQKKTSKQVEKQLS